MKFLNLLLVGFLGFLAAVLGNSQGSIEITTAMVDQFSANVLHLSQQKESRLWAHCRQESQEAEAKFYDRIGKKAARRKEGRHADVVYSDTPHSRRMVTLEDFYDADLADKEDKLRTIMNIENEYAQAIAYALGRQIDEEIINAALGNAYGGKKGTVAVPFPDSQKLCSTNAAGTAFAGLNVAALRRCRKKLKQSEAIMKGEKVNFVMAAQQADDLLGQTEVTSSDYASVKALVDGETNTFMGFNFIETELLPFNEAAINTADFATGTIGGGGDTINAGEGRRCIAFTEKRGLLGAMPRKVNGRLDELPGKHYSVQVYGALSFGATRMEEEQVVEVLSYEV